MNRLNARYQLYCEMIDYCTRPDVTDTAGAHRALKEAYGYGCTIMAIRKGYRK